MEHLPGYDRWLNGFGIPPMDEEETGERCDECDCYPCRCEEKERGWCR